MSDGYWTNTARSWLGQGLAMGWGDELEARLRTLSGDETYEEELAAINESYNQYSAENPGASLTGEIVGGFIPTAAALIATPFTGGATAPVAAAPVNSVVVVVASPGYQDGGPSLFPCHDQRRCFQHGRVVRVARRGRKGGGHIV